MVTRFKQGEVRYSLLTSPRARRDWEVTLSDIGPDPSLWSKRDDAKGRGGKLKEANVKRPERTVAPRGKRYRGR